MQVTFWGVRGSIPTPGPTTQRWGGNTSCLEVRHGDLPPLVLDCGTGARSLGMKLVGERGRKLQLLFTHFHMDHVFGFPFFAPIYTPGYEVDVAIPAYSEEEARERLARYLNGVYHPTRLREVPANITFRAIRAGRAFSCDGYEVTPFRLNHPGGSLAYKIGVGDQYIAYVTDTAPFARPGEGAAASLPAEGREAKLIAFLAGANVVVYDTMYDLDEYLEKMTWGHSYPEYAVALCRAAGVEHLVLFHHAPDHDDDRLDEREARMAATEGLRVSMAREGETLNVEG